MTEPTAERKADYEAIDNAKQLYDRYAGHGRLDEPRNILAWTGEPIDESPFAYRNPNASCSLIGISNDYSEFAKSIGKPEILDSHGMKAFLLAHEDMHCRIGAEPFKADADGKLTSERDRLLQRFDGLVNESAADSMAILVTARRDGVPAALNVLDQVQQLRTNDGKDPGHDSRATLDLLRDTLNTHPERFASDEAAFKTAITTGVQGAVQTYPGQLTAQERSVLDSKEFSTLMNNQAKRFADALDNYRNGAYPATPQIIETSSGTSKRFNVEMHINGRNAFNHVEQDSLRDRVKDILGEIKTGESRAMDAGENAYTRGRNMLQSPQTNTVTDSLTNRPQGLRM